VELTSQQHRDNVEYRRGFKCVMFQFMATKVSKILETIFDEIEYRIAKRSIRHSGQSRKSLLSKF